MLYRRLKLQQHPAVTDEQDTVPVAPKTFGLDPAVTIQDALNKKYVLSSAYWLKALHLVLWAILTAGSPIA